MKTAQDVLAVFVTQDLKNSTAPELFDAISKQLHLKRDDWIDILMSMNKKYHITVYDFEKKRKKKIHSKYKYEKYLRKLKSKDFKIYTMNVFYNLFQRTFNPIAKQLKGANDEN